MFFYDLIKRTSIEDADDHIGRYLLVYFRIKIKVFAKFCEMYRYLYNNQIKNAKGHPLTAHFPYVPHTYNTIDANYFIQFILLSFSYGHT